MLEEPSTEAERIGRTLTTHGGRPTPRTGRRRVRRGTGMLLALVAFWAVPLAHAQADPGAYEAQDEPLVTVKGHADDGSTPGLFSVGVSGGFPSYQTVAISVALQAEFVGAQLKGSWTPAGVYLGGQLRVYPPIPVPVPLYIGVGGGVYGSNVSYHIAAGAHVPLGKNLRLDLEGGLANVPQLNDRAWAPHIAVGVSYAFPLELTPSSTTNERPARTETPASPSCTSPGAPDADLIPAVIGRIVDDWILSARATYGSVYTDLSYTYSLRRVLVSGNNADVTVAYSGSVTEILTGVRQKASGDAQVQLSWTGCGWGGAAVSY